MDFKKLTAQEVASKRFTPVRMREGYSIDEVDEFLEAVENTINAYNDEESVLQREKAELANRPAPVPTADPAELAELKRRLESTLRELADSQGRVQALQGSVETMGTQLIEARNAAETANQGKIAAELATANAIEMAHNAQSVVEKPMDIAGASGAVARMLETAAKNYDDLVAQGEAEAKLIKDHAGVEAAEVLSRAEKEASSTLAEANAAKNDAFAAIENQKRGLEDAVQHLRVVEARSREELIRVYSAGLNEVQNTPSVTRDESVSTQTASVRRSPASEAHSNPAFGDVPSFNS